MKELGNGLILFQFFHSYDLARILEDGPWSFDKSLILMQPVPEDQRPEEVCLSHASFWVQVHGLPGGFMSMKVAHVVGDYVGAFEKADPRNFDGGCKEFMRVRVRVDVTQPLKRRMKLKREGGDWFFAEFKYERLPTFCFVCGRLGHSERFCALQMELPREGHVSGYGVWLRAGGRRGAAEGG